jgi:hypothetical protein
MESALRKHLPARRFDDVDRMRSEAMRRIRAKGNKSTEQRLRFALVSRRVRGWVLHAKHLPGRPDFVFPRRKLAVFVDGADTSPRRIRHFGVPRSASTKGVTRRSTGSCSPRASRCFESGSTNSTMICLVVFRRFVDSWKNRHIWIARRRDHLPMDQTAPRQSPTRNGTRFLVAAGRPDPPRQGYAAKCSDCGSE